MACISYRVADGLGDMGPVSDKTGEMFPALASHCVVDTRASVYELAAGFESALALERVQGGINDALAQADGVVGLGADRLHEFVAVHLPRLKESQDQELRHTVHETGIGHGYLYILVRCINT